jgi:hypothetical protein
MMLRARLALAALLLAPSCGQDVTLGSDLPPPCQGKPCGAPCTFDPCAGAAVCGAPVAEGFCADDGSCAPMPLLCKPPCKGLPCGAPCSPPLPMQPPGGFVCDSHEQCVPEPGACGVLYDPCMGKKCGAPCTLCPPMDPMCVEGPPGSCDPMGTCMAGSPPMCP